MRSILRLKKKKKKKRVLLSWPTQQRLFLLLRNRVILFPCILLCFFRFYLSFSFLLSSFYIFEFWEIKKRKYFGVISLFFCCLVYFLSSQPTIRCQNNKVVLCCNSSRTRRLKINVFFFFKFFFGFFLFFYFFLVSLHINFTLHLFSITERVTFGKFSLSFNFFTKIVFIKNDYLKYVWYSLHINEW